MASRALIPATAFVGCVVAANVLTSRYGLVPLGLGLVVSAGTFTAGLALLVRDWLDEAGGRVWVLVAIVVGAAVSAATTPNAAFEGVIAQLDEQVGIPIMRGVPLASRS